ncbi:beta-galactosidase [Saccharothrix syringae]|uniref:Beta-galactosidase n=1 Tax=Saccharothrix syringae TaxID=103733 RepID=A0A5Q0GRL1_SACSY|nr:beta-galactosidase [Saccharothrix syringae]QFZ16609.1 beta-galactosidase [Saccharothrix syringae]
MTTWPTGLRGPAWGADYNPEQWPEAVWADDVALMRRAGVNLVSVGVFSWALLEVAEGRYEFGWLDRVLDRLHEGGIRVDLATATASPPPWLTTAHPEVLPETAEGVRLSHGSRQSYCPSSAVYREKAVALAGALARRYREHPALAAWHVGNEYGCHVPRCYCDRCAEAFRAWLRSRHGDLDALNEAWGTAFWSQHYTAWDQVLPPRATPALGNPGQLLDFDRFSSDALLELFKAERDVLREVTPGVPVTTNFMVTWTFGALDYWRWADEVDFVANDHYTRADDPERHVELAFSADLARGLARGRPWLLMEHSTSAVNWQPRNLAKQPGELRRNSYQHLARGADGTLFFQWRQSRAGAERYHSAMVPHAGPDTAVFAEVERVGAEYARIAELVGSTVEAAPVAVVYDWESGWVLGQPAHPTVDFSHREHALALYRALWRAGVAVDFLPPGAPLAPYRAVVLPALHLVDDAGPYADYVEGGGRLLVTYLSGITDTRGHVHLGGHPGAFRDLLGVRTEEFFPLAAGQEVALDDGSSARVWTEHLRAGDAEVLASYVDGPLPGVPAVTRRDVGEGAAWYLACGLTGAGLDRLVEAVLDHAGVPRGTAGVEVVRRRGARAGAPVSWLVAVNHGGGDAELPAVGVELLSGERVPGRVVVPAGGVVVVREEV